MAANDKVWLIFFVHNLSLLSSDARGEVFSRPLKLVPRDVQIHTQIHQFLTA